MIKRFMERSVRTIVVAISLFTFVLFFVNSTSFAQESGNRAYGQQRRRPQPSSGILTTGESRSLFIEANILLNAKADAYVVVFGAAQEGKTADESNTKVNDVISNFTKSLNALGITKSDIYVDFITQNKTYEYKQSDTNTVTEELSGFETKKTIAVRYKERAQLEPIITAATKASIFDLIKVDYVINDLPALRQRLYEEATKVIKQKEEKYKTSFSLKLAPIAITNEKYDSFFPGELYNNYQAFESGTTYGSYSNNYRVIQKRKSGTLYYEPLDATEFDSVINTMGIEPVVQFTLYLRVQYSLS
jgi:uncharacterized protein YggE